MLSDDSLKIVNVRADLDFGDGKSSGNRLISRYRHRRSRYRINQSVDLDWLRHKMCQFHRKCGCSQPIALLHDSTLDTNENESHRPISHANNFDHFRRMVLQLLVKVCILYFPYFILLVGFFSRRNSVRFGVFVCVSLMWCDVKYIFPHLNELMHTRMNVNRTKVVGGFIL